MSEDMMWFDVNNVEHLAAYKILADTGMWPKGFISDAVTLPHLWTIRIQSKMADEWVKHGMAGNIPGMPAYDPDSTNNKG